MIKKTPSQFWFPFWVDKWIFGSMRIEFAPEERALWVDLLALAAKDDGFIRANEDTPYSVRQLAGMLVYDEEFFSKTIEKFVEKKKINRDGNGILYISNWIKYKISPAYKRVLKYRAKLKNETDSVSKDTKPVTHIKSNHIKSNHIKSNINMLFEKWWSRYPRKEDKGKAKEKYVHLIKVKKIDPQMLEDALTGYRYCLESKNTEIHYVKYAKTFLYAGNPEEGILGTWEQYLKYADPKYKPGPPL